MFDWPDLSFFSSAIDTRAERVDGFNKGKQNGEGNKQHSLHGGGVMKITNAKWADGKLNGENVCVSMARCRHTRLLIGNFTNNILTSGTLYFVSVARRRYKFTFNNAEITDMHQYWYPTRFEKIHWMKRYLYYYRSFIFGLNSEHAQTNININTPEPSAALYGEDGQCFDGEFIITANQEMDFDLEREEFDKNDLCPLYLMLYDLFTHTDELILFNGTITFDSFIKDQNNQYKYLVNKNCPLKYTCKVHNQLVELEDTFKKLKDNDEISSDPCDEILALTKYFYTSNCLITPCMNNPTIRQMKMPTHPQRIVGTIEMCVMINNDKDKSDVDDEKVDLDRHDLFLGVFPTGRDELRKFALGDENVMKLTQKLAMNINDPKAIQQCDLFNEGLVVHYDGGCNLKLRTMYYSPVPFELHATNGVLYIRYNDVLKEKYLKSNCKNSCNDSNSSTNSSLSVDGKKYMLNVRIGCWESRIDKTSFVRYVTLHGCTDEIVKKINLMDRLNCKFGKPDTLNTALLSLECANKLKKQAIQDNQDEVEKKENDTKKIHSDINQIVYRRISVFFELIGVDSWSSFIVNNWKNPQVIELLYRSQLYKLIDECICHFEDNGKLVKGDHSVINSSDSEGWNILHYAAYLNDLRYVQLCLKALRPLQNLQLFSGRMATQLVLKQDINNSLPIHIAAQNGNIRILRELVGSYQKLGGGPIYGINYSNLFHQKTKDCWTPLELSIIYDQKECCKFLYSKMKLPNGFVRSGFTAATLAAQR